MSKLFKDFNAFGLGSGVAFFLITVVIYQTSVKDTAAFLLVSKMVLNLVGSLAFAHIMTIASGKFKISQIVFCYTTCAVLISLVYYLLFQLNPINYFAPHMSMILGTAILLLVYDVRIRQAKDDAAAFTKEQEENNSL